MGGLCERYLCLQCDHINIPIGGVFHEFLGFPTYRKLSTHMGISLKTFVDFILSDLFVGGLNVNFLQAICEDDTSKAQLSLNSELLLVYLGGMFLSLTKVG